MNIKILRLGKFGNCIIKILNSIQIALFYKYNIIIPVHPLFNTTYIKINNAVDINEPCITDPNEFFYPSKINDIDRKLFHMNHDKAIEILQAIFKYPNGTIKIEDNDLLIHVRGDDLFGDIVHPGYIPSPLIYFKDIISNKNWNNIYLVSKDKKNPVVNELLSTYPKIIYISGKLEDDIYYILQAKNVVIDVGTFIPSILLFF